MKQTFTYYSQLRSELSTWLDQSARIDGPGRNRGGEDEANYALSWLPHYLIAREAATAERFRSLLSDLASWVTHDCVHGYEPEAEAHHGTEPFLLFLPRYAGLFPDDELPPKLLEDAAHHIGNWVDGIPDWYDYECDCFRSYRIGAELVDDDPHFAYELAEHLRFVHIALAAHRILGEDRYLEWALRYGRQRAERILRSVTDSWPLLWDLEGNGLQWADLTTREQHSMSGNAHHLEGDPLSGLENLLASGAMQVFGDLYLLSGEQVFQDVARRMAESLVAELVDPFGDPAAAAVAHYRWTFADTSLDDVIAAQLAEMPAESSAPWAMIFPQQHRRREAGVGKRTDMIYWGEFAEDGSVAPLKEPSTAALTLAYQLTGKVAHARRALRGAATRLSMARRVLRGGREHADMGGAVCSVAAGHGRNWGTGAVTGCYGPLVLGTREIRGQLSPLIEVRDGAGNDRVPEAVLSLVRPAVGGDGELLLYNGSEAEVGLSWRSATGKATGLPAESAREEAAWTQVTLGAGEEKAQSIE
ncbi:MAG: hypothetical protein VX911_04535 [Candidatus Latescibacterota bacterium]|nr:hypothetical protein [Candidatus Latescibacterota bacterium]